jgi:hypothetical protein
MGLDTLEAHIKYLYRPSYVRATYMSNILMFQIYIAKIDLDVVYVAMAIHVCCECITISNVCCNYFI